LKAGKSIPLRRVLVSLLAGLTLPAWANFRFTREGYVTPLSTLPPSFALAEDPFAEPEVTFTDPDGRLELALPGPFRLQLEVADVAHTGDTTPCVLLDCDPLASLLPPASPLTDPVFFAGVDNGLYPSVEEPLPRELLGGVAPRADADGDGIPDGEAGSAPYPSVLRAWFRSDAGLKLVEGEVTEWVDQGPGAHRFTPPQAGPTVVSDAVNGLPGVSFDGTQFLEGSLGGVPLTGASIFATFRYGTPDSDNDYLYNFGAPAGPGSQMSLSRRPGRSAYHYDGSSQELGAFDTLPHDTWLVSSQVFGEASEDDHDLYLNGGAVLRTNSASAYSADVTTSVIGNWSSGSYGFVGELVELLVYERTLGEAERTNVEDYLAARAGLPEFSLPGAEKLSDWQVVQYEFGAQADAEWNFDLGGTRASQEANSDASILLSDLDVAGRVLWGELGAGIAPDFMGFVFGYRNPGEFYLFDWKRTTASYLSFGTAEAGMRLTAFHVDSGTPTGRDFWASDVAENTTLLRRNSMPWTPGAVYRFSLSFLPGAFRIRVWEGLNLIEQWEVEDATHPSGRFGYFVNSLQDVRFGQVFAMPMEPLRVEGIRQEGAGIRLDWCGGEPPFVIERSETLTDWQDASGVLWRIDHVEPIDRGRALLRVRSLGEEVGP